MNLQNSKTLKKKYNLHPSNFEKEIPLIKEKFMKVDYSLLFINSVVNEFQKSKECGNKSFIIPPSLCEIAKPFISIEMPMK